MYYIYYLIYDIRTKILHEPYLSIYTQLINVYCLSVYILDVHSFMARIKML